MEAILDFSKHLDVGLYDSIVLCMNSGTDPQKVSRSF